MKKNYKGYKVEIWRQFVNTEANLVAITCYEVKNPKISSLFVFGDPLLVRVGRLDLSSEKIEEMQFEMIREKIDGNNINNFEEYVFEYYGSNYLEEENVSWWKKSFKKQAGQLGLI